MGEFRKRILRPLSFPLIAVLFVGALVISLSRVLLAVPTASSTLIALIVAAEVLGIASLIAATSRTKPAQRALMLLLALSLIGGGVASAEIGTRHEELVVGVPEAISRILADISFVETKRASRKPSIRANSLSRSSSASTNRPKARPPSGSAAS